MTSVALNPQQAKAEEACSNQSLYGTYEVQGSGYLDYTKPFAFTALNTYDGNGHIKIALLAVSVAGNVGTNVSSQGTYQVNSDCSLTITTISANGMTSNNSGVLFDDNNKYAITDTNSGTIVNIKAERVRHLYKSH
jgi:hypothetical protein